MNDFHVDMNEYICRLRDVVFKTLRQANPDRRTAAGRTSDGDCPGQQAGCEPYAGT